MKLPGSLKSAYDRWWLMPLIIISLSITYVFGIIYNLEWVIRLSLFLWLILLVLQYGSVFYYANKGLLVLPIFIILFNTVIAVLIILYTISVIVVGDH